jgi:AmmeMemoRadiSam system protein B
VAVSSADAFATPLGPVPVDTAARDDLLARGLVVEDDAAHAGEHSLEVHLPFLQVALGEVTILPLAVGAVTILPLAVGAVAAGEVAALLDHVWGGPESLVVVSTDLSHYLDSVTATALDRETAAVVTARRYEELVPERACGAYPLRGLLAAADRRGLNVELLALRNSSDVDGRGERVVGYGAFAVG